MVFKTEVTFIRRIRRAGRIAAADAASTTMTAAAAGSGERHADEILAQAVLKLASEE